MQDQYIHDDAYHCALNRLEAIARTLEPAAPDDLRTRIIEVLGDLGIWPISCIAGHDEGDVPLAA